MKLRTPKYDAMFWMDVITGAVTRHPKPKTREEKDNLLEAMIASAASYMVESYADNTGDVTSDEVDLGTKIMKAMWAAGIACVKEVRP